MSKKKDSLGLEEIKVRSEEVAGILKTIGHPKRLLILCMLADSKHTVQELEEACEVGQSQLSQFLKRMELEGLLKSTRDGRYVYYEISKDEIKELINSLQEIFCS